MRVTKSGIEVRLSAIARPGGWAKGLDLALVEEYRRKIRRGVKMPPVRLTTARELVYGKHRLRAAELEKCGTIRADLVQYDSAGEREADELGENLHRRALDSDERRRGLARLVEIFAAEAGESGGDDAVGNSTADAVKLRAASTEKQAVSATPKRGRPPSRQGAAVRRAAKVGGASVDTVERAVKESEEKKAAKDAPPTPSSPPAPPPPCVPSFGLAVPAQVDGRARRVLVAVEEADKLLRALARLVNGLEDSGAAPKDAAAAVRALELAGDAIRGCRPETLCPWCKAVVKVADCNFCRGTGYGTARAMKQSPPPDELLRSGAEAMVMDGPGKFRLLNGGGTVKAPVNGKHIRIVDESGNELRPEDESQEPPATPDEEIPF